MSVEPVLSVRSLSISVPVAATRAAAVANVSFDVPPGGRLGLVGESGSGKTLTALALMRLLKPPVRVDSGSALLEGRDMLCLSARELNEIRGARIAMIYQNPMSALNPVVPIGRQLTEVLALHGRYSKVAARRRAVELLGDVGIASPQRQFDSYPHELSGGMRQRVVIAMAMSCEPRVVIADEPTTALDVTTQARMLALMHRLVDEHATAFVLITHDLGVAAEFCDEVLVMYAGRIVERNTVPRLFERPNHPYTLALLKSRCSVDTDPDEPIPTVTGQPPQIGNHPSGCAFHPRCPEAIDVCRQIRPALVDLADVSVACWRAAGYPAASDVGVRS
jgi:peptide/nickel transport system ATP-binding protein